MHDEQVKLVLVTARRGVDRTTKGATCAKSDIVKQDDQHIDTQTGVQRHFARFGRPVFACRNNRSSTNQNSRILAVGNSNTHYKVGPCRPKISYRNEIICRVWSAIEEG